MTRTKATVRGLSQVRIGSKNILNRRIRNIPFKIKQILPQSKRVDVTKNGQVVRRINVRRKAVYFFGKRRLNFV